MASAVPQKCFKKCWALAPVGSSPERRDVHEASTALVRSPELLRYGGSRFSQSQRDNVGTDPEDARKLPLTKIHIGKLLFDGRFDPLARLLVDSWYQACAPPVAASIKPARRALISDEVLDAINIIH